jgi:hypothetical protein
MMMMSMKMNDGDDDLWILWMMSFVAAAVD